MNKVALVDNNTLRITAGVRYELYTFEVRGLVAVINDVGDKVIMSKYDFED